MAELNPPLFLQNHNAHTARGDRLLIATLVPEDNCLDTNYLRVTESGTPAMSVDVAAGRCIIHGTESPLQGAYHCVNDDKKTIAIAAADSTNDRIDIVVARVYDAEYSGVDNKFAIEVITGTPALSPTAPTAPDNSIVLAEVEVKANASSIVDADITDTRPVSPLGGTAAKGYITQTIQTTDLGSVSGSGNVPGLAAVFTAEPNRRYKVSVQAFARQLTAPGTIYLTLSGGGLTGRRVTGVRMDGSNTNNDRDIMHGFVFITPNPGPVTMQVGYESSAASITLLGSFVPSVVTVEDVGPAS